MKKAVSFIITVVLLISSFALYIGAASEHSGITLPRIKTASLSHPTAFYVTQKRFDKMPMTFEAWVYLPKSIHSQRVGVILGTYNNSTKDVYVNFEIEAGGVPKLIFGEQDGTEHKYLFDKAAVPADKWTHIAIIYATGTDSKQIFCYIDGHLKQQTSPASFYRPNDSFMDNQICLAGDYRTFNTQGFRGTLGDIAVYSDVRTPEEVLNDASNPPDTTDSELMMYYELSKTDNATDVIDKSGNGYDMVYSRFWLTEEEMEEIRKDYGYEYSYALAFLPDIQYMTQSYPQNLKKLFDYLVDHGKEKNIQYVIGLGDITHTNTPKEWKTVLEQTERLNGLIPYSLISGNHDAVLDTKLGLFDQTYADKSGFYYKHVAENGGFMNPESVRNTYLCFSVGAVDYIIINLDFGATDDILDWAGEILSEHSNRRAIIATHGYSYADGTTLDSTDSSRPSYYNKKLNDGEDIWQKFVSKYENIDMVVSGHISRHDVACTVRRGDAGNNVYQLLMDTQGACKTLGGVGVVGLMYFTEDGSHARIEYYSTVYEKYFCESNKIIELEFEKVDEEITEIETTDSSQTDNVTEPPINIHTEELTEEGSLTVTSEQSGGCRSDLSIISAVLVICAVPLIGKTSKKY